MVQPINRLGYLKAIVIKPVPRGAGAFAPAYSQVPYSTYNGFPPKYPGPAGQLLQTTFSLNGLGGAAGYPNPGPRTTPLLANPYINSGATE